MIQLASTPTLLSGLFFHARRLAGQKTDTIRRKQHSPPPCRLNTTPQLFHYAIG